MKLREFLTQAWLNGGYKDWGISNLRSLEAFAQFPTAEVDAYSQGCIVRYVEAHEQNRSGSKKLCSAYFVSHDGLTRAYIANRVDKKEIDKIVAVFISEVENPTYETINDFNYNVKEGIIDLSDPILDKEE